MFLLSTWHWHIYIVVISVFSYSLLVWRNTTDVSTVILYFRILLNSFFSFQQLFLWILKIMCIICKSIQIYFFLSSLYLSLLLALLHWLGHPVKYWRQMLRMEIFIFFPKLRTIKCGIRWRTGKMLFFNLKFLSISTILRAFIMIWYCIAKLTFCIYWKY